MIPIELILFLKDRGERVVLELFQGSLQARLTGAVEKVQEAVIASPQGKAVTISYLDLLSTWINLSFIFDISPHFRYILSRKVLYAS
jgi:hypothetical protein